MRERREEVKHIIVDSIKIDIKLFILVTASHYHNALTQMYCKLACIVTRYKKLYKYFAVKTFEHGEKVLDIETRMNAMDNEINEWIMRSKRFRAYYL